MINQNSNITADSDEIIIDGYRGTWYVIDTENIDGKELFLLESEVYGDEAAGIIIDKNRNVILDDVWNGFADYRDMVGEEEREQSTLDTAKKYIEDFIKSEYSSTADFSDMQHISIGYTEIGSEEQGDFPFQVEADLINCAINYYIDGEIAKTEKYDSLIEMNEQRLSCLDFEDMLHIGTTELDRILAEKEKNAPIKTVLAVSQNDTNRYYIANDVTEEAVRNAIKNSDRLFMDLCALGGTQITEAEFAQYSQTDGVIAIDVNIDEQTMHIYDADKPITSFDDIRSDNHDLIAQLDDIIASCQKIKDTLITEGLGINKTVLHKGIER